MIIEVFLFSLVIHCMEKNSSYITEIFKSALEGHREKMREYERDRKREQRKKIKAVRLNAAASLLKLHSSSANPSSSSCLAEKPPRKPRERRCIEIPKKDMEEIAQREGLSS